MNVNEFDEETMSIKLDQLPDPVGEFHTLLFQVEGVLVQFSLMELLVKTRFDEEGFAVSSVIIMSNDIGNDFQTYGSHFFSYFFRKSITKE